MANKAWTPLRIVVLVAAGIGTLFWLASLVLWWTMPDASRDGFEIIAIALTTAYFVLLVLPALLLGLFGRALRFAAVLGVIIVALSSDTLWPWLPWWLLG